MKAYFIYTYIILFAKSMSFVHIVISILVDSFLLLKLYLFEIQVFQFVHLVFLLF